MQNIDDLQQPMLSHRFKHIELWNIECRIRKESDRIGEQNMPEK